MYGPKDSKAKVVVLCLIRSHHLANTTLGLGYRSYLNIHHPVYS